MPVLHRKEDIIKHGNNIRKHLPKKLQKNYDYLDSNSFLQVLEPAHIFSLLILIQCTFVYRTCRRLFFFLAVDSVTFRCINSTWILVVHCLHQIEHVVAFLLIKLRIGYFAFFFKFSNALLKRCLTCQNINQRFSCVLI